MHSTRYEKEDADRYDELIETRNWPSIHEALASMMEKSTANLASQQQEYQNIFFFKKKKAYNQ